MDSTRCDGPSEVQPTTSPVSSRDIPRVIWTFWLQGWDSAPPLVQACLRSWQVRNPTWTIRPLSADNIGDYLDLTSVYPDVRLDQMSPVNLSDVVRIALLAEHGGVWVDSTLFCVRSLDEWIDDYSPTGFFAFARPGPDRMISNWFLASVPGQPLTVELRDRVRTYWRNRTAAHHYFWFHRLFAAAYASDDDFSRIWDATPKVRSDGPHYFVPYRTRLAGRMTGRARARVLSGRDPVYKLSHRTWPSRSGTETAHDFFCRWADSPVWPPRDGSADRRVLLAVDQASERLRWTLRHVATGVRAEVAERLRDAGVRRPSDGLPAHLHLAQLLRQRSD